MKDLSKATKQLNEAKTALEQVQRAHSIHPTQENRKRVEEAQKKYNGCNRTYRSVARLPMEGV